MLHGSETVTKQPIFAAFVFAGERVMKKKFSVFVEFSFCLYLELFLYCVSDATTGRARYNARVAFPSEPEVLPSSITTLNTDFFAAWRAESENASLE